MVGIGKGLQLIVYTRTITGIPNIEVIPLAIKIAENNSLCFDLICDELDAYLEKLNENIHDYEEITYAFDNDSEITSLYPQKMMKGEKQCTN